jgi:preprotein translocase subunit SecD
MTTDTRNRLIILIGVVLIALVFLAPTIFRDKMPETWVSRPLSLGLDLSGGVHLVYQVEVEDAVKGHLNGIGNQIRAELRAKKKIPVTRVRALDDGSVELTLFSERSVDEALKLIDEQFRQQVAVRGRRVEDGRGILVLGISEAQRAEIERGAVNQAVETLRNRVDKFGVAEPLIQTQGERRILLQMAGFSDIEAVKRVVGKTAKLEFRFVPSAPGGATIALKDRDGAPVSVEDELAMGGDAIKTAAIAFPQGQFEVHLTMTPEGRDIFRRISTENVGRQLAIIMDGVVFSSPVIKGPIPDGNAVISGGFSESEAKELSVVLRAGALPAALTVLEERTVGPTLGQESVRAGVISILVGYVAIVAFMAFYYRKSGWVANVSLALNLLLCVAALSAFGATLTLPGLAGLALTIGMAVDSNVIIFERIRDELNNGSSRDSAVHQGFTSATTAIVDANVTTLLSGIVLYFLGTGSIKGFAVTLAVGITTTVFCAVFASRVLFDVFELKGKERGLSI